jgi:hypothetical protein
MFSRDRTFQIPEDFPEPLRLYVELLYADAWHAYRDAGVPFGRSDVGMMLWFNYDQHTRRN